MTPPRHVLWLLSALLLSTVTKVTIAVPEIVTQPDTLVLGTGAAAHLRCRVNDLGSNKVTWRRMDHNIMISEGLTILAEDRVKYAVLPVLDSSAFDLQILYLNKYDQGFYECAIKGTDQSVIMHLDIIGVDNFPTSHAPVEPLNKTECCKAENVRETCLPACLPDPIDLDTFDAAANCGSLPDLNALSKCYTDGSNHASCCLAQGVDPLCLPFCHHDIQVETLTFDHFTTCLQNSVINSLFKCFASGSELLPGPPTQVSALALYSSQKISSILVEWQPPSKNPDRVTGYVIMYRKKGDEHFMSNPQPATSRQYRLDRDLQSNTEYEIYVIATSQHGGSLGSVSIFEFIPDDSKLNQQNIDINACCSNRLVSDTCRERLCQAKTWSQFSSRDFLECVVHMDDIFSCLTAEQNNTACCSAYGVDNQCLPLCSGHPPVFDNSLLTCVFDMNIIEACVQRGHGQLPKPPTRLTLDEVSSDFAVLSYKPSDNVNVQSYMVQLSEGPDRDNFVDKMSIPGNPSVTEFRLDDLKANTEYSVRLVTMTTTSGSLPSDTLSFLTYPESEGQPTVPPVVNRPHDLKECCKSKGMPQLCWEGCIYRTNITSYYSNKLDVCQNHIGSVLSCAADGRDHTSCCIQRGMPNNCLGLCTMTQVGQLNPSFYPCVSTTSIAILCFMEGIADLPRHPDITIENVTLHTITISWKQPETSGLIDSYIISYGMAGQNMTMVTTNDTTYILQNLLPGTEYLISAQSVNENGTSVASPQRTVFTPANFLLPIINQTVPTGRALWENIVHCCNNSGVSPMCLDMCSNAPATHVVESKECEADHHKMLACFNNGQDHTVCCRSANLPDDCLPLCAGHPVDQTLVMATCMSYGHRDTILGCILENQDLVPSVPVDFTASMIGNGEVSMTWSRPTQSCFDDCKFDVHYWVKDQPNEVTDLVDQQSPLSVKLMVDKFYVFTVVGRNTYGAGSPAPWVTVFLPNLNRDVKVELVGEKPYVEKNAGAILECSTSGFSEDDPPTIQWVFNNNRELTGKTQKFLMLPKVDPLRDEGLYTCTAKDSILTSSSSLYLPIQYEPKLDQMREESGPVGGISRISCWFKGNPDSEVDRWLLNNKPIHNLTSNKYKLTHDQRYHTGITTYKIRIDDMTLEDYGMYSISVHNKFGSTSCSTNLQDPSTEPPVEPPAKKVADPLQCCKDNGLTDLCQDLCTFDIDLSETLNNPKYVSCLFSFETIIKCGADERDHTKCCQNHGVMPYCFPFCRGNAPGSVLNETEQMLTCVADSDTIFKCLQEGHAFIPYPPRDVTVSKINATSALVTWNRPEFNYDLVQHYNVYYSTGKSQQQNVHSVSDKVKSYTIRDLVPNIVYTIKVTAGNSKGESLPSNSVQYPKYSEPAPTSVKVDPVTDTNVVRITWEAAMGATNFKVYYKKLSDKEYMLQGLTTNKYFDFRNLSPRTEYEAYVVSIFPDGEQSAASDKIRFTTGARMEKQQADDDDNAVQIGVGVTVAILAVAAIIFIVLFFLFRARIKTARLSDTVTFENPGYGNAGTVKIEGLDDDSYNYGRLKEDNVEQNQYDNPSSGAVMESVTDTHAYDNPMATQESQQTNGSGGQTPATLDL